MLKRSFKVDFLKSELTKKDVVEKTIGLGELEHIIIKPIIKSPDRYNYQTQDKFYVGKIEEGVRGNFFHEKGDIFKARRSEIEKDEGYYLSHSKAFALNFCGAVLKSLEFIEEESGIKYYGAVLEGVELRKKSLGKISSDIFYYDIVGLEVEFGTKKDLLK